MSGTERLPKKKNPNPIALLQMFDFRKWLIGRKKTEQSDYSAFSHEQLEELMNNIIILLKGMK